MSLVHAEYLKLSRRRLYPVMVVILAVLVAMLAFFLLILGQIAPDLAGEVPVLEKPDAYSYGVQQVAGQTWFPLILAVVMLGGEFGSTVWATALTRDSRRLNQVSARFLVLVGASWVAVILATAGWAVVVAVASPGVGGLGMSEWLEAVWKLGLVQLAWAAIGLGAVALFRSVGPAIGAALALLFIDSILGLLDAYENVSISAATTALFPTPGFGDGFGSAFESLIPGSGLSTTHAIAIMVGWAALGFVLTWWGLQRRDA
jgi:hypothetical protein